MNVLKAVKPATMTAGQAFEHINKLEKQFAELNNLVGYCHENNLPYAKEVITLMREATLEEINRIKSKLEKVTI